MIGDINVDNQDLKMAQGAFDSQEDEASYQRWLDEIALQEELREREVEGKILSTSQYTDCGRPIGSPYEGQD